MAINEQKIVRDIVMKEIMVVFTGGTIGSMKQGSAIDVNQAGSYMIIDQYLEQYDASVTFSTMQPINILSENLLSEQWLQLAEQIRSIAQNKLTGIIVTHGSDTLAYSAAMLSYMLSDTNVPIVLIASNYPLGDERANGLRNFSNAVRWMEQDAPAGVFVVYENDLGESELYLGTRIMQCETFTDQFRSPYELTLGKLHQGRLIKADDARNPSFAELKPAQHKWLEPIKSLKQIANDIQYIKPYPGLNYELYQWGAKRPLAIVHDLYHSGTACAIADGPYSLTRFIARCNEQHIPVYLCPVKSAAEAQYASTAKLIDAGAIILEGIGIEAAMTKLMLAYSLFKEEKEVLAFMQQEQLYYERHQ